jgi:hypothetical protein
MNSKIKKKENLHEKVNIMDSRLRGTWCTHDTLVSALHVLIMLMPVPWLRSASCLVYASDNRYDMVVF